MCTPPPPVYKALFYRSQSLSRLFKVEPWAEIAALVEGDAGLMELKSGHSRPLPDSVSASIFSKWVQQALIRPKALRTELFFLAAANLHEAGAFAV